MHHREYTRVKGDYLEQHAHNQRVDILDRLDRIDHWLGHIAGVLRRMAHEQGQTTTGAEAPAFGSPVPASPPDIWEEGPPIADPSEEPHT